MTVELIFYFILFSFGLLICITKISNKIYNAITLFLFVTFSLVVRNAGFDADIGNYAEYLKIKSFSVYYIKEAVYWLGSRVIYQLTDSAYAVFVIYDLLFFILILFVRQKLELPKYFPYLILLFFPTVMGMQNVFRQFIASGILLALFAQVLTLQKMPVKLMTFLLAGLTHNVSFLFLPIVFIKPNSRKMSPLFLASALPILVLLPIAASTKSNSITGEVPAYIYTMLFSLMIIGYASIFQFKFKNKPPIFSQFVYFFMFCYALIVEAMFVLGAAQSKRLGMFSLVLCLVPLVMSVEIRFKQKTFVRCVFLIVLVSPTLIFKNALSLLQTSEESLRIEATSRNMNHKGTH